MLSYPLPVFPSAGTHSWVKEQSPLEPGGGKKVIQVSASGAPASAGPFIS